MDWGDLRKEGGRREEPEDLEALDFVTFEHVGEVARRKELGSVFRDYRELQRLAVGAEMEREVRSAVDGGGRPRAIGITGPYAQGKRPRRRVEAQKRAQVGHDSSRACCLECC